jgi:hypothetical protein
MTENQACKVFAKICLDLGIEPETVHLRIIPSDQSPYTDIKNGIIYIHDFSNEDVCDTSLVFAHELRHIYQSRNMKGKMDLEMKRYKHFPECKSLDEYNLQWPELDANAFAMYWCNRNLGLTPMFAQCPKKPLVMGFFRYVLIDK